MDAFEPFYDRVDAGRRLAEMLAPLKEELPVVLGLPRGGVVVAAEVARALGAPLDVLVARKLSDPRNPELGIGAIASGGITVVDEAFADRLGISREQIDDSARCEHEELERREKLYRPRAPVDLTGRTAIIVDDGVATGVTALAAIKSARLRGPKRVVFAAPVCSIQAKQLLEREADDVVCGIAPALMNAVGAWYGDFRQVEDEEVIEALGGS